jgi:hypothetical protein
VRDLISDEACGSPHEHPAAGARRVAGNSRRWWRNRDRLLKAVLTVAYFDRLGVPRLS